MPEPVRLSHETIDTALYAMPRGDLQTRVPALLRRRRRRMKRRSRSRGGAGGARSRFADPVKLIDRRPPEVGLRLVPGQWEAT